MRRISIGATVVYYFWSHLWPTSAAVTYRTVALSGQQAPAGGGEVFASFGVSALNSSGRAAFSARYTVGVSGVTTANDTSLWSEGTGSLELVAREGYQAPGAPAGANYSGNLIAVLLNDAGHTAFEADLAVGSGGVTSENNQGIWSSVSGSVDLIARKGSPAPGIGGDANFGSFFFPNINDSGEIAFTGGLASGGGVTTANNEGVWVMRDGGPLALLAREGSQAPGMPTGTNFGGSNLDLFSFSSAEIDDAGRVTFQSYFGGTTSPDAIWSDRAGSLDVIMRSGVSAPDVPAGTIFGILGSSPEINGTSQISIRTTFELDPPAVTNDNRLALYTEGSGVLGLVARQGDQAPGTSVGTQFGFISPGMLNDAGRTAFYSSLQGSSPDLTSLNNQAMWSQGFGGLAIVARAGDQAPDVPAGAVFEKFDMFGYRPQINNAGQTAFAGKLRQGLGGVTSANDGAMWVQDLAGALRLVVREGDSFAVALGDVRTIATVGPTGMFTPEGDARGFRLNDDGTIAFVLTFTDGSQGVFTAALVPEPGVVGLTCAALVWLMVPTTRRIAALKGRSSELRPLRQR